MLMMTIERNPGSSSCCRNVDHHDESLRSSFTSHNCRAEECQCVLELTPNNIQQPRKLQRHQKIVVDLVSRQRPSSSSHLKCAQ